MPQDSYIKLFSKGDVFEGIVVMVNDTPSSFGDKTLFPVVIRDPKNSVKEKTITATDFLASEITTGESLLKNHLGKVVKFVIKSPGDGTPGKPPWIKLDEPMMPTSNTDLRDKLFTSRDSYRMALDLIIAQPDKFKYDQIDEIARKLARKILTLSSEL